MASENGAALRRLMDAVGIKSIAALARRARVSRNTIYVAFIHGRRPPSRRTIARLAVVLGIHKHRVARLAEAT